MNFLEKKLQERRYRKFEEEEKRFSLERYEATLMGCAVGDSLGLCVESWKPEQIRKYIGKITAPMDPVLVKDAKGNLVTEDEFGKIKYFNYNEGARKGDITDDTILTLALADAIIESEMYDIKAIARHFTKAIDKKQSGLGFKGGFGRATLAAYQKLLRGAHPKESGILDANGNGPVMKTSPIGLYADALRRDGEKNVIRTCVDYALETAKMTHLAVPAIAAAGVQSYAIYSLVKSPSYAPEDKDRLMHELSILSYEIEEILLEKSPYKVQGSLTPKIDWVFNNMHNVTEEEAYKELGNGSLVTQSYPFALYMFQRYILPWHTKGEERKKDALDGLLATVNWGGDCDTTGAIYGALAGANVGKFWPDSFEPKESERIKNTAKLLYQLSG